MQTKVYGRKEAPRRAVLLLFDRLSRGLLVNVYYSKGIVDPRPAEINGYKRYKPGK